LTRAGSKKVLLSRRFDREDETRIPFLSALSMLGLKDGDRASYPELVDALTEHGSRAREDAHELYRRMAFSVLVSNVDDHLRNHGFCCAGREGWRLSPAFDLNPTPVDIRPRILTTAISLDDATCDLELVLSVASYFGLGSADARSAVKQVAASTAAWREVARAAGVSTAEIRRMESAFEHVDLERAQAL
jgi:serine/threonine-protein kinase HipA